MLKFLRSAAPPASQPPSAETFSGTSFLQLEPDLAKEAGLGAREVPSWGRGGSFPSTQ